MPIIKNKEQSVPISPPASAVVGTEAVINANRKVAEVVHKIGQTADEMARRGVSQGSQEAGRKAALEGNFKPRKDPTFAAQEYNRAGLNTYLSELEINMRDNIERIYDQNKHDPNQLDSTLAAYRDELASSLSGDMEVVAPEMRQMFDRATRPLKRTAADNYERVLLSNNAAKTNQVLERRINDGERLARASYSDETYIDDLAEEKDYFEASLLENGPKEGFSFNGIDYDPDPGRSGVFSPQDMESMSQQWDEKMETSYVLGGFDSAVDREKYINDWETRERGRKGSPFSLPQVESIADGMRAEIRADRAKLSAEEKRVKELVSDAEKVFDAGKTPTGILSLKQAAAPFPKLAERIDMAQQSSLIVSNFSRMHPVAQQQVLTQLEGEKTATVQEVETIKRLKTVQAETQNLLNNDPVRLLPRQNITVSPVDISNPMTWRARNDTSAQVESMYGVPHHGFTADEVSAIDAVLSNNTAEDNAMYMQAMAQSLAPDHMVQLLTDLAPKQPEFSAAAGLTDVRPDLSRDILRGSDMMKNPDFKGVLPSAEDIQLTANNVLGDSIEGNNRNMIVQAAIALDVARRQDAGKLAKSEFDSDDLEAAIQDITGGVYEFNGRKIIAPAYDVNEDEFEDLIDALTQDDIKGMFAGDRQIDIQSFKDNAVLHNERQGSYVISIADGFAHTEAGDPFVLNLQELLPDLRARIARPRRLRGLNVAPTQ